jgi:proteic killer suppression protein
VAVALGDPCITERNAVVAMIRRFHDRITEAVFRGRCPKGFPADLFKAARRRLIALDAATSLDDLKIPASNRLHALARDRSGQHSIAVNDQFRICFVWTESGP